MIEDQLTRDERIRLESLAQAVNRSTMRDATPHEVIATAAVFEEWLRTGDVD